MDESTKKLCDDFDQSRGRKGIGVIVLIAAGWLSLEDPQVLEYFKEVVPPERVERLLASRRRTLSSRPTA